MFLPDYPERISSVAPGGSFSRAVVGRCPIRVWGGPVEPATVAKVEAPLNGRVLWKGLPRVSRPRACSGNPYRINKKGQHHNLGRVSGQLKFMSKALITLINPLPR